MRIVGSGFLARQLRSIATKHADVEMFAAGVSNSAETRGDAFDCEARRVYDAIERCAREGRRLVYFSTSSKGLYGDQPGPVFEDGPAFPVSAYGRNKLAMESVIARSGVDHLILRLAYPIGVGQQPRQFFPAMIDQVRSGAAQIRRGAVRDLIDVDDMVRLVDELLTVGAGGQIVNLASGVAVPVEDFVLSVAERLGTVVRRDHIDVPPEPALSVDRLRRLAPCFDELGFAPDYYRKVIDKYLDQVLDAARR
jgi:nucleoside-diphosphate-sugar epimerase